MHLLYYRKQKDDLRASDHLHTSLESVLHTDVIWVLFNHTQKDELLHAHKHTNASGRSSTSSSAYITAVTTF